jgi:4-oxalocrotonate tautomerase
MPLVRIELLKGKPPEYRRALADGVYRALVEAVGAPENA